MAQLCVYACVCAWLFIHGLHGLAIMWVDYCHFVVNNCTQANRPTPKMSKNILCSAVCSKAQTIYGR